MPRRRSLLALAVALALGGGAQADESAQIDSFRPLTSFGVAGTAEIVQATPDGNTLAYTDSSRGLIGFVDITDPLHPVVTAEVPVAGEPTSVDITPDGRFALATVWTNKPVIGEPPPAGISANEGGALLVIRMADKRIVRTIEIGFHPDSVKATIVAGRTVAVVAIENEPIYVKDGVVVDEDADEPKTDVSPPGLIQIVTANRVFDVPIPADLLAAAGALNVDDPQPEFVAIHDGEAAVSLQENNAIARVDIFNRALTQVFGLGKLADRPADLTEDDTIAFVETYPADVLGEGPEVGSRIPDAIAYSPDGTVLFSADEGELDYTGGRGWSAWSAADGAFLWDDGGSIEAEAVRFSHYPEGRSENKGIEVEGVATARFGTRDFAFLLSERGSFMAVYDVAEPHTPELVQILPTGVSPEGVVAIPSRGLVVTADEVSGTLSLFEGVAGLYQPSVTQPQLYSRSVEVPWAAISGLAWQRPNWLSAVPDNALPSAIYRIRTGQPFAEVSVRTPVTRGGEQARYDLEGIAVDTSILAPKKHAGWWLANEGNAATGEDFQPNLLVQVSARGEVLREVRLPAAIESADGGLIRSNGFEGVAVSDDGRYLLAAIQREFKGEDAAFTRIARVDLEDLHCTDDAGVRRCDGDWAFFLYPLDPMDDPDNWIGLSEIFRIDDETYGVIERDKELGIRSQVKRLYRFSLEGLRDGDVITKTLAVDLLDTFFPYEKVEGATVSGKDGSVWVALDNDGGEVESRLVDIGPLDDEDGDEDEDEDEHDDRDRDGKAD